LIGLSEGETDTGRTLEPHDRGCGVPGVRVVLDLCLTIVDDPRSILLHETKHGRASWTTVEPDDHGIVDGVTLGLSEGVMETLSVSDVKVTGVSSGVKCLCVG